MATSGNLPSLAWGCRELYVAALMEADNERMTARIADAERVILARARELLKASGDNIQEGEALDDALYALAALKTCLEIHGGFAAVAYVVSENALGTAHFRRNSSTIRTRGSGN